MVEDIDNTEVKKKSKKGVSIRGMALALVLNIMFTLVSTYLGLSLGIGLSFSAINVLIAYAFLKNAKKAEVTFVTIAGQAYAVWWLAGMGIFLRMQKDVDLPTWLVPSRDILLHGSIFSKAWILPFCTITFISMTGVLLSIIIGSVIADDILEKKEMKFPMFQVTGTTINAVLAGEENKRGQSKSQLLFKWMGIGGILVTLQGILAILGLPAQMIDFTSFFRQYRTAFALNLMLVFVGIGIIIEPKVSLTTVGAGLFIYLGLIPLASYFGYVSIPAEAYVPLRGQTVIMSFYNWILFNFLLSPALGIAILGPVIPGIINIILQKLKKEKTKAGKREEKEKNIGFFEFMKVLIKRLRENKIASVLFLSLTVVTVVFMVSASIFNIGIGFTLVLAALVIIMGFIDSWIMIRMAGEIGMTMGMHRLVFYETPLALSGVRNWTGYIACPKVNPWSSSGIIGFTKMARMTNTKKSSIIKAYLFRLIPGVTVGTLTTLFLWYMFHFPSQEVPGVPLYRNYLILKLFVSGDLKGFVNPIIMLLSGVIVGVLGMVTPISIMGVSFAMFLPVSYLVPIGLGGVIRLYIHKKKGKEWFKDQGRIIVSGFVAGATIFQILISVVSLTI